MARIIARVGAASASLAALLLLLAHAAGAVSVDIGPVTLWLGSTTVGIGVHGQGQSARFGDVQDVVEHPTTHDIYIVDQGSNVIRKVPFGSSTTEDWLGTLGAGSGSATVSGTGAKFTSPHQAVITPDGLDMYISDYGNHHIRKVTIADRSNAVFAGTSGSLGGTDATGTAATFQNPLGLALNGGLLFVTEWGGNRIRKVTLSTAAVVRLYGAGSGGTNGDATTAQFSRPHGIGYWQPDKLVVSESAGHRIRLVPASGSGSTSTLAGDGTGGATDGAGTGAQFNGPKGLAINAAGTYAFVADNFGRRVRRVSLTSPFQVDTVMGDGTFTLLAAAVSTQTKVKPQAVSFSLDFMTLYVSCSGGVMYARVSETSTTSTPAPPTTTSTTPVPSTSTSTTPVPSTSTSTTPVPSTSTSTTPVPSTSTSTTPVPSTSTSTTPVPSTSTSTTPVPSTSTSTTPAPSTSTSATTVPTTSTSTTMPVPSTTLPVNFTFPANFTGLDAAAFFGGGSMMLVTAIVASAIAVAVASSKL